MCNNKDNIPLLSLVDNRELWICSCFKIKKDDNTKQKKLVLTNMKYPSFLQNLIYNINEIINFIFYELNEIYKCIKIFEIYWVFNNKRNNYIIKNFLFDAANLVWVLKCQTCRDPYLILINEKQIELYNNYSFFDNLNKLIKWKKRNFRVPFAFSRSGGRNNPKRLTQFNRNILKYKDINTIILDLKNKNNINYDSIDNSNKEKIKEFEQLWKLWLINIREILFIRIHILNICKFLLFNK